MKLDEIIMIAKENNGYIYTDLIKKYHINYTYISRLVKKGKLIKVASGIYITNETIEDIFYINSLRFSNLVYCGDTAIFLNGLSNKQFPDYEAIVPYGTKIPKIDGFVVRQTRKDNFILGIVEVMTPFGNRVKCYNKERSICDLFIRPNHYSYEDRVYAIHEYKLNYLNYDKLYDYAKKLGVYDLVWNVFEVLIN